MSSTPTPDVVTAVAELCALARRLSAGTVHVDRADAIEARFDGPLRVAIAGRVKAGKSTLLNALVGERLATTDAGECTRIVTVYRHAAGYEVTAIRHDGTREPLRFRRADGALQVDLGALTPDDVAQLDVGWPASTLRGLTLVDTPGLASLDGPTSRRTLDFMAHHHEQVSGADAVIYLMRHLHRTDGEFLAAFMDRSVAGASPVHAIALLSRADEVGAGRLDAMESAATIAARYRDRSEVSTLVSDVLPVAGLLAETAMSLREDEVAALRSIAALPEATRALVLLSADDFCDVAHTEITVERRRDLLDRLGLFGARWAVADLIPDPSRSAGDLARSLADRSGIDAVRRRIEQQFGPRARLLQARSAMLALRDLAAVLTTTDAHAGGRLRAELDRLETTAVEFARLTAVHLVMSGAATLPPSERDEVVQLLEKGTGDVAGNDGRADDGDTASRRAEAIAGIERWRSRAEDPLASTAVVTVADTMTRWYEHRYVTA
ncbi:MAG: 50S ribosome-binding GTPase [Acidimicrobiales bacterium]|nr:50S ribosome-binding GTPase [Acidimicrobiales bacterium]